ncbi:MAG: hypothetical protein AB7E42_03165 [Anaerotignaceae bacterium]
MSKIKFESIDNVFTELNDTICKAKISGNIIEISHSLYQNKGNYIKKIDKDTYINTKYPYTLIDKTFYQLKSDGEIFAMFTFDNYITSEYEMYTVVTAYNSTLDTSFKFINYNEECDFFYKMEYFKKNSNRSQTPNELRKTFKKISDVINCNTTEYWKCKLITLTYSENMQDTKELYTDFNNFKKKLIRRLGKFEYISVAEPQSRGAWHLHIILIFNCKAPYISNKELASLWNNGFTTTNNIKKNNNLGVYLTAYLSNIPVEEFNSLCDNEQERIIKFVGTYEEIVLEDENKEKKRFIKGGRLHFYPISFNILRTSRGIKRPIVFSDTKINILKNHNISNKNLTFKKTTKLTILDDSEELIKFENIFHKEFYNKKVTI